MAMLTGGLSMLVQALLTEFRTLQETKQDKNEDRGVGGDHRRGEES